LGIGDRHTEFWWGELKKKRYHLEGQGIRSKIILKLIFKKWDGKAWTGLFWLCRETSDGHF
jgi:hypothetical protein